jgi:uncharacterized protein (TIGR02145 family)
LATDSDCNFPDPAATPRQGICPADWHIPTNTEWLALNTYLAVDGQGGVGTDVGGKIKEAGTAHWTSENCGSATCDSTGFSALGGGARYNYSGGLFDELRSSGYFWEADPVASSANTSKKISIMGADPGFYDGDDYRNVAFSVRCLMD